MHTTEALEQTGVPTLTVGVMLEYNHNSINNSLWIVTFIIKIP